MGAQNHVTGAVYDTIVRVRSDIIEWLVDGCCSAFGGGGLLGANSAKDHKVFVVNCTHIIQQCNCYALDTSDGRLIKIVAGIFVGGELLLGAIHYAAVLVGR